MSTMLTNDQKTEVYLQCKSQFKKKGSLFWGISSELLTVLSNNSTLMVFQLNPAVTLNHVSFLFLLSNWSDNESLPSPVNDAAAF